MSSNIHRFVILCICWDTCTPSEKTCLWQLQIVLGVFKHFFPRCPIGVQNTSDLQSAARTLEKHTPQMNIMLKKSSWTPNHLEVARNMNQASVCRSWYSSNALMKRCWDLKALTVLSPVSDADRWEKTGLRAVERRRAILLFIYFYFLCKSPDTQGLKATSRCGLQLIFPEAVATYS